MISGNPEITSVTKQDTLAQFRIFRIQSTDSLHVGFSSLALVGGHAPDGTAEGLHGKHGGGIYVPDSIHQLTLTDCRIEGNHSGDGYRSYSATITGSGGNGGGIYSLSKLQFYNCQVINNLTGNGANAYSGGEWDSQSAGLGGNGGGIYCKNDLLLEGCTINFNHTGKGGDASGSTYSGGGDGGHGGAGGAIYCGKGTITIADVIVDSNFTGSGGYAWNTHQNCSAGNGGQGGAMYFDNCCVIISNSIISNNFTGFGNSASGNERGYGGDGGKGGGIHALNAYLTIYNVSLTKNYTGKGGSSGGYSQGVSPGDGGNGAGIFTDNCYFSADRSMISENRTGNGATTGDYYISGGNAVFKNSILPGGNYSLPRGGSGGGIFINKSNNRIINSSIANNYAGTAEIVAAEDKKTVMISDSIRGQGGGVFASADSAEIINSILAFNYLGFDSIGNNIEGVVRMNFSLLSSDTLCTIIGTENLLNTDPRFQSFPDDLSLTPASHAINHGSTDTTGLFLPGIDLAGNPRFYGERIDIGAYEFQGDPQNHWIIPFDTILMDTVLVGGFSTDSLYILNYGIQTLVISTIITNAPFSVSLDALNWYGSLENINIPAGEPLLSKTIFVKFEGLAPRQFRDSIIFTIGDSAKVVYISGVCLSTEGIIEDENKINLLASPNPLKQETMISFYLEEPGDINLCVYNSSGVKLEEVKMKEQPEGLNTLAWKRQNLPDGLYFMEIKHQNSTRLIKLIITSQ